MAIWGSRNVLVIARADGLHHVSASGGACVRNVLGTGEGVEK